MNETEFKARTKRLALSILGLVETMPKRTTAQVIGRQLLRCGTSVGANYRAACRSKSTLDMLAKLAIVEEEADEALYWLELAVESVMLPSSAALGVTKETEEILAMTVASMKTLRSKR